MAGRSSQSLDPESRQYLIPLDQFARGVKHSALTDDQIIVMRLPSNEEMESWSKKFREMFR